MSKPYAGRRGTQERMNEVAVNLSCGHTLTFPAPAPNSGDVLWCSRCQEDSLCESHKFTGKLWTTR